MAISDRGIALPFSPLLRWEKMAGFCGERFSSTAEFFPPPLPSRDIFFPFLPSPSVFLFQAAAQNLLTNTKALFLFPHWNKGAFFLLSFPPSFAIEGFFPFFLFFLRSFLDLWTRLRRGCLSSRDGTCRTFFLFWQDDGSSLFFSLFPSCLQGKVPPFPFPCTGLGGFFGVSWQILPAALGRSLLLFSFSSSMSGGTLLKRNWTGVFFSPFVR